MAMLLLALCLSQAPLTTPPLAVPAEAAPSSPEAVAPGAEPAEVKLFAQFVERHLLAISSSGAGFEVRQRERVFRIQDDDFVTVFSLVPDAVASARVAHDDFVTAQWLQIVGLALAGGALVATIASTVARALIVPLLVASLIGSGVGLVLALIALPFAISAQTRFFSAIASYNHGLLELRPPPSPVAGGLSFALPE